MKRKFWPDEHEPATDALDVLQESLLRNLEDEEGEIPEENMRRFLRELMVDYAVYYSQSRGNRRQAMDLLRSLVVDAGLQLDEALGHPGKERTKEHYRWSGL